MKFFHGAFTKLEKGTISFIITICPSIIIDQLGCYWVDFCEILYGVFYQKILCVAWLLDLWTTSVFAVFDANVHISQKILPNLG